MQQRRQEDIVCDPLTNVSGSVNVQGIVNTKRASVKRGMQLFRGHFPVCNDNVRFAFTSPQGRADSCGGIPTTEGDDIIIGGRRPCGARMVYHMSRREESGANGLAERAIVNGTEDVCHGRHPFEGV